ncbi:MAG: hypothetical protein GXP49_08095 [Deltaproteobacteria bacterium]|nr:hypothetical protein [Deltaproteobacteria bacterium]
MAGNIDSAELNIQHALTIYPDLNTVKNVEEDVIKAHDNSKEIRSIRKERLEVKIKGLRGKVAGKKLVIVGSPDEKEWKEVLRGELALSKMEWITTSYGKAPGSEHISSSIGRNTAAVIVYCFIGHMDSPAAKRKAEQVGVSH